MESSDANFPTSLQAIGPPREEKIIEIQPNLIETNTKDFTSISNPASMIMELNTGIILSFNKEALTFF